MHTHHGAHGRARRPRHAAHTGTTSWTRAAEDVGPYHHAMPVPPHHAHHVHAPCPHAMPHVMSAPPHHGTHGRARRPRRAAHTGTTSGTTRVRGPPGTSAPTNMHTHHAHTMPAPMRAMSTHHAHAMPAPCTRTMIPMVGRDVPGAPRPRGQHRERHMDARRPHRVPRLGRTPVQPGAEGASAVRASARTASRSTSFAFVLRMKPPGCAKSA